MADAEMNMQKKPRVSVVIPIYNAEEYIGDTIRSVISQAYSDIEIILVNDGSTDSSPDICRSFSDPRIVRVDQENRGLSSARNAGLAAARGDIIGLIDADDLWHPQKIAAHVAHFDSDETLGVSYSSCQFINKDGRELNNQYRPKIESITAADVFCRNPISGGSAAMFRREIFEDIIEPRSGDGHMHYFDIEASGPRFSRAEDHQCWMRMAIHSKLKFGGIDRLLTYYRIHDAGLSANIENMHKGWREIDSYVAQVAPGLHEMHSPTANAYQMRYFARRLIARGDAKEAFVFIGRSLRASLKPLFQEPTKSFVTMAAATTLLLAPGVAKRLLQRQSSVRDS